MANVIEILDSCKGRVIEAEEIELLKVAFELQNKINEQLDKLNSTVSANYQLQNEKVDRLEKENHALQAEVTELRASVASSSYEPSYVPSGLPHEILMQFRNQDKTALWQRDLLQVFEKKIELESAMDELTANNILRVARIGEKGKDYALTQEGRRLVSKLERTHVIRSSSRM